MKKLLALALGVLILIGICGCGKKSAEPATKPLSEPAETTISVLEEPTVPTLPEVVEVPEGFLFPDGTSILNVDVSGLSHAEALTAINESLSAYTLTVVANNNWVNFTAADIGLNCPDNALGAYISAFEKNEDVSQIPLIFYDSAAVRQRLSANLNISAKNASIRYDSAADTFKLSEASNGLEVDISSIVAAADPVIRALEPELHITVNEEEIEPAITAESPEAKNALAKANTFLTISLTYSYTPDNAQTRYETLTKDNIGSLIAFEGNLTPYISSSALRKYVNDMSAKYSVKGDAGQFKTTGGYYISLTVDYAGQPVDTDGLYEDIHYCLSNGISGTRTAPYLDPIECEEMAFDGNYVEVNLSAQYLWVYRNGNCVVSTPIVSGCAYYRRTTPTGVYSIYSKSRGVYLVGDDYCSWVNYWMPFSGGYGLHDASWRSSFGGDIYLYDGSHGCVNLPSGAAASVYDNVSVGTKVILYGGATRAEPVVQNMIGTTEYNVTLGTQPFKLDAQPEFGEDKSVTYVSSNPAVAEVAADGTVTVKGVGTTYVTVTAPERAYYTSAEMIVTINVTDPCQQSGHTWGVPVIVTPATCTTNGEQTVTCTVCGFTENQPIQALGHQFGTWNITTDPDCTNPGQQEHSCSVCGITESEEIPATGHSVSSWTVTDSTCTASGHKSGICNTCGATVTEEIPPKSHDYTSGGPYCDYGCGTPNPNYLPPAQDDDEDTTEPPASEKTTDPPNP